MYVCLCNAIKEEELRAAFDPSDEASDEGVLALYKRLGAEPICGSCVDYACELIAHYRRHEE